MSACVLSIPADRAEWGPVLRVGTVSCMQTAKLYQGDVAVCHVTVQWPAPDPTVPVTTCVDGRHAGEND